MVKRISNLPDSPSMHYVTIVPLHIGKNRLLSKMAWFEKNPFAVEKNAYSMWPMFDSS